MEKKKRLITAAIMGILPLVLCVIYCAIYGKTIGDIYLPNSSWNDELLYYKQVEGVLKNGVPSGYFGYNESRAKALSFASWSPVLLIHWVLWGLLFGWNFLSPILCNLVCMMAGMATFAWLARPNRNQTIALMALVSLFTPATRYILSCTPESFFYAFMLWYMGCLFAYEKDEKEKYLWQMYGIAAFLSLARPYFLLFLFYPVIVMKKSFRIKCLTALSSIFWGAAYVTLSKLFSAEYFQGIIIISFLESFQKNGFSAGIKTFFSQLADRAYELKIYLGLALDFGDLSGSIYAVVGSMEILFLLAAVAEYGKRKKDGYFRLMVSAAIAYAVMMAAITFGYSLGAGSRHLIIFILIGITILGMYSAKIISKTMQIFLGIALGFFFLYQPDIPYIRLPPFREEQLAEEIDALNRTLQEKMTYTSGITWANTVIWLSDDILDGEMSETAWQQLYALPDGYGINFCTQNYVVEHIDTLKAGYIAVMPGGEVEKMLVERNAPLMGRNESIAVYQITQI